MLTPLGRKSIDLMYQLKELGNAAAVLHVGAHPDDEDVGLLTYLTRKLGVRAVYWSATRGEGGQNRINEYADESIGIYRTWESLAARAGSGGESLFGPFYDFGFSKNGDEALKKWGRDEVIREIARAIRIVQPHVVVTRWAGTPHDGHGHHQAIGQIMLEAFEAAADPSRYPELEEIGLGPWQAVKLYSSTAGDWNPGQEGGAFGARDEQLEESGAIRVNTGELDPIAGATYQEQAWTGFNEHKTQAMGMLPTVGDFFYYYMLQKSLVPVADREKSLFDGIDTSLTGLADHPGGGSPELRRSLREIHDVTERAWDLFRLDDPRPAAEPLLEGASRLLDIIDALPAAPDLEDTTRHALARYLRRKLEEFDEVAAWCLGLELEAGSDDAHVVPGQTFKAAARLWNHRDIPVEKTSFSIITPEGWTQASEHRFVHDDDSPTAVFGITVPIDATLSSPYWLREPRELYRYVWPEAPFCGFPFGHETLRVECEVLVGGRRLTLRKPVVRRQSFPGGFRELPVSVIPPISLHPEAERAFAMSGEDRELELFVVAQNNVEGAATGTVTVDVPDGWIVEPEEVDVTFSAVDQQRTLRHVVKIPAAADPANYEITYQVRFAGRDYRSTFTPVRLAAPHLGAMTDASNCLDERFIVGPSRVKVHIVDVSFAEGLKYAYVEGADEKVVETMRPLGIEFVVIPDEDMAVVDLDDFDAVVIGPNAYLVREEVRAEPTRWLDYVARGGTLIVQYQGYDYAAPGLTPYGFEYSQPHDRVTMEDAEVEILDPEDPLFKFPNPIGPADFEGWVMDRGMYFFGTWNDAYRPLLASHDPGEEPRLGGLLVCEHGDGRYVYVGYSLWRQIAAGVPGAFRLFANILALPQATKQLSAGR